MSDTNTNTADQSVAKTILAQLGGSRFVAMTGSNTFTSKPDSLTMKLTRNQAAATHLVITLAPNDTYSLEFIACRMSRKTGITRKTVRLIEDVYCDVLQSTFTTVTGLYTSLGSMGR